MAQQTINIGTSANKGDGDPIRVAFDKVNDNFTDLYTRVVVLEGGGVAVAQDIQGDIFAQDSSLAYNSATNTHYGSFVGALDGDVTGSVFADNSTLIIDGGTGTINSSVLVGNLPALDGSALTNLTIPAQTFASLTGTPTTIAGYGITDATSSASPAFTGTVDFTGSTSVDFTGATITGTSFLTSYTETDPVVGAITGLVKSDGAGNISAAVAGTDYLTTVAFADVTGTPTTLAGYGITDAANTSAETTFTADVKFDTGVEEAFGTLTGSTGVVAHDCDNGHVFYHTGASGDITANFTNLGLTAEYATNLTVIINQGATPYEVTAVQIGGAAQTIEWQGGSQPTGNANGIDSFSFTILNDGGSYVVLGQMVDFT